MGTTSSSLPYDTIVAFTLYGFGCTRCGNEARFYAGAPRGTFCGTSCGQVQFETDSPLLKQISQDLNTAADEAMEEIHPGSYLWCSQCDASAGRAAKVLNDGWCQRWNEQLQTEGMRCFAASEVYGFGRSRATYLVIRIVKGN